MQEEHWLLCCK